jgi:hypothetical protein
MQQGLRGAPRSGAAQALLECCGLLVMDPGPAATAAGLLNAVQSLRASKHVLRLRHAARFTPVPSRRFPLLLHLSQPPKVVPLLF